MARKLEVHPAAAVWPMLPDDELQALADSIADVGLLEPVVVTPDGLVLDGRNRLAACKLAKVEPTFVTYDGEEPTAYVLARNDSRRHMTKGQRAMASWLTATTAHNNYEHDGDVAGPAGVSTAMVQWARTVAEHTPDMTTAVVAGAVPLKAAYDAAIKARNSATDGVQRLDKLPDDLATLVREEAMPIDEAEAAARQREQRRADEQRDARALLTRIVDLCAPDHQTTAHLDAWVDQLGDVEPEMVSRIDNAIDSLTYLAKRVRP